MKIHIKNKGVKGVYLCGKLISSKSGRGSPTCKMCIKIKKLQQIGKFIIKNFHLLR